MIILSNVHDKEFLASIRIFLKQEFFQGFNFYILQ